MRFFLLIQDTVRLDHYTGTWVSGSASYRKYYPGHNLESNWATNERCFGHKCLEATLLVH